MDERMFGIEEYRFKTDGGTAAYTLTERQLRYLFLKRMIDVVVSLAAVVLLMIPMLLIALILKILYPQTPVLFRQKRVGRNGELFTLVKFSSMKGGAISPEQKGRPMTLYRGKKEAEECGNCVTRFGRFLRRSSLDELPQLFQVLSGKMSLIGPRPLIPQEREIHTVRWDAGVYQLCPGITGWAQVNGRRMLSDERKAAYDREYLDKMSFSMDWKIFRMTIRQVIHREGMDE